MVGIKTGCITILLEHYCMPLCLQCRENINELPPSIANQLLLVARVAYEGIRDGIDMCSLILELSLIILV